MKNANKQEKQLESIALSHRPTCNYFVFLADITQNYNSS